MAAAPLTIALWLNAINRQRFGQQMRQYNQSAIADVHQVVQSLHHRVNTLPPAETANLEPISQSLKNLVQRFDNRPELEQIQELHKTISSLPHSLEVEIRDRCPDTGITTIPGA